MNKEKTPREQNIAAGSCKVSIIWIALLWLLLLSLPQIADAAEIRRVALLIGNADYSFAPLKNPLNDANDLGSRFAAIGFETTVITNPGYEQFRSAIRW